MGKKIKLCFLTDNFPPDVGGATYLFLLGQQLQNRGYDLSVITASTLPSRDRRFDHKSTYPIYRSKLINQYLNKLNQTGNTLEFIYSKIEEIKPDLLYVHNYPLMLLVMLMGNSLKSKVVFSCHNTPTPDSGKIVGLFPDYPLLEKEFGDYLIKNRRYDLLLAPSKYYFNWWKKIGAMSSKIRLIYRGIDNDHFKVMPINTKLRHSLGFFDNDYVLLVVARTIPRKGIQDVITALKQLPSKVKLLIATGSGGYSRQDYLIQLKQLAAKLGLTKRIVWAVNRFSYPEMPQVYAAADMVIMPSHFEELGLASLEALSCGKPLVATDVPGTDEIVEDKKNGLMVPAKSPASIAEAVSSLMDNPALAKKLATTGRQQITKNWSILREVDKTDQLFRKLLYS